AGSGARREGQGLQAVSDQRLRHGQGEAQGRVHALPAGPPGGGGHGGGVRVEGLGGLPAGRQSAARPEGGSGPAHGRNPGRPRLETRSGLTVLTPTCQNDRLAAQRCVSFSTRGKMSTYVCKQEDADRKWVVIDAQGQTLGRLSTLVARLLM